MPARSEERTTRELLGPLAAVALISQTHPTLPAPSVELATVFTDSGDHGLGVRLHLHEPADGVYERWANIIGSDDPDSHTRHTAEGEVRRRKTYGFYGTTPIELTGYPPAGRDA
ncbi:hypothetical protein [Streptomyces spiramyceticus]|uniref:hypothetical protein n=1 Tax=Streptomyces spiramyceticus TaxID=299717 RepID=UPI00237B07AF|nr:hypothetical protein [Streptomyces spiramyceticus]